MKRLLLLTFIFITACGPSQKEKEEIAIVTCNIIGESRNMDGALRIKEINAAREKIGEGAFLGSDEDIKISLEENLCKELVLNNYEAALFAKGKAYKEARLQAEEARDKYRAALIKKLKNYKPVLTLIPSTDSSSQPDIGISCTNGLAGNGLWLDLKGGKQIILSVPFEDEICHLTPRQLIIPCCDPFQFDEIESAQIRVVIFEQKKEDVSLHGLDLDQETIRVMNSLNIGSRNFAKIPINVSISDN